MKKSLVSAILIAALLTACAQSQVHFADPVDVEKALAESEALAAEVAAEKIETTTAEPKPTQVQTEEPEPTPEPTSVPTPAVEREAEPTVEPEQNPATVPQSDSAPDPTPAPTPEPAPAPAYGAVPFELAAGTDKWWKIDATVSAYWAMQEQINAVRAAGGLPALAMDDGLSAIASTRCESFVAGGPFDHSGMTTTSEILAAGPLGSASAACAAWVASDVHYANIMRTDISSMGVGCWFCDTDQGQYTYWTVTFQ